MNFAQLTDPGFWFIWIQIVILDLTLAGDNALVIALAVRNLPKRQQWQGRLWGTFGAVALRVAFIGVITVCSAFRCSRRSAAACSSGSP